MGREGAGELMGKGIREGEGGEANLWEGQMLGN